MFDLAVTCFTQLQEFFLKARMFGFQKNPGCYSPPSLQESRPRDLGVSVTREEGSSLSSHVHQFICFAVGVLKRSFLEKVVCIQLSKRRNFIFIKHGEIF